MDKTKKERLKHLKEVLSIQTASRKQENMVAFLYREFDRIDNGKMHIYSKDGNVYITKGSADTYPCVISHMDTVHNLIEDFHIYHHGDVLFSIDHKTYSQTGIGGDDKVGVFCCLEALENNDVIKVAFFRDEEIGCLGSKDADMEFFKDVSFVLQADRKGYKDFVRKISGNNLYTDAFADAINPILEKYGKEECLLGGSTDVNQLHKNEIGVCVANSSCGYYNPHRDKEYVVISEVFKTSELFLDIINKVHVDGKRWEAPKWKPYTPPVRTNYASAGRSYNPQDHYFQEGFNDIDTFLFNEQLDRTIPQNVAVSCGSCGEDITSLFDSTEDGYYCLGCNQYSYLSTSRWAVNRDFPDSNLIKRMIDDKRKKRMKRRARRK